MIDYDIFARPEFDANDYANAVLAGDTYPSQQPKAPIVSRPSKSTHLEPSKEHISIVLSKLNIGIDDVAKQLRTVVTNHHEALLTLAAGANDLQDSLVVVRSRLDEVTQSLEKIRVPYQTLAGHVSRLQRLQLAADVLRRTARFVIVARRLEFQMAGTNQATGSGTATVASINEPHVNGAGDDSHEGERERNIAQAALSIAELTSLLEDVEPRPGSPTASADESEDKSISEGQTIPLRSINAVIGYLPAIERARQTVTSEMENMIVSGLTTLNQPLLASSLQTAFNLHLLPQLVSSLVADLTETVQIRIQSTFDLSRMSKEVSTKDSSSSPSLVYKSRVRTEPTNLTAPQWTSALWSRLESLVEDLASCCIKVYTLEKVLNMKKDAASHTQFLDEAMKSLDNKPSSIFWTTLARSLEKNSLDAAKGTSNKRSSFLQQTLSTGYPRFLRLFHEFFAKIGVHTDTHYSQSRQSPETILVLGAVSHFEAIYLSRSLNRLNESVGQAMAGGVRAPPGATEGVSIARTVANELDSAKFDPLLVKAVAKNVNTALEGLLGRVDVLIVRDRSATSMLGPTASPQLVLNAQLVMALHGCWSKLIKLEGEHTADVFSVFEVAVQNIQRMNERTYEPLLLAIRREVSSIIARLHRVDFGKTLDDIPPGMGGASAYMKELVDKLSFVRKEVLSRYNIGEIAQEWTISIVKYVIRAFVNHVSIAKPLGESGKLQLTSDMTELEFALNAFIADNGKNVAKLDAIGQDYRALRALRPLLFLENARLASPEHTGEIPPLVVLHHILVRSPIPLPHTLHGWHEAEYVRWVDEHSEEESWTLIESGLTHWEKMHEGEDVDTRVAEEYVRLARDVLQNIKRVA